MVTYFFLFMIPAGLALWEASVGGRNVLGARTSGSSLGWKFFLGLIFLLVGTRRDVGGDWLHYDFSFNVTSGLSFYDTLTSSDPAYKVVEWGAAFLGFDVLAVNLVAAALFVFGLSRFCLSLPRPWLALCVSIPYLVIVVGMGYTRQSVAIGLVMAGLVNLKKGEFAKFSTWVVLAALFHKSAVLVLPFSALVGSTKRVWVLFFAGASTVLAYYVLLAEYSDQLLENYVDAEYASEGALVRLLINLIAAFLYWVWLRQMSLLRGDGKIWHWQAGFAILLFLFYFVTPASTALDRLALYLLPLQIYVFASLPSSFRERSAGSWIALMASLVFYLAVLLVWLNFATHSIYWVPYQSFLF